MATGNFSNGGQDTFDPKKHNLGVRLQQGVPLLDRDWNELEDIRRWYERTLRKFYLGEGVPDESGFQISQPSTATGSFDFVIGPGRCLVNGYDVENDAPLYYSQQVGVPSLPIPIAKPMTIYLLPTVERIDATTDPALRNAQDINLVTCLRDRLTWKVLAAIPPEVPPAESHTLARIDPIGGLTDLRRTGLNLAELHDAIADLRLKIADHEARIAQMQLDLQKTKQQIARLFWDVSVKTSGSVRLFGDSATISITVIDGVGQPVQNARLSFSTDWGYLKPSTIATNTAGLATVELHGFDVNTAPPESHVSTLKNVAKKVQAAYIAGSEVVQYSKVKLQPEEMKLVSLYTSPGLLANISIDLPTGPVVSLPPPRTATVTVHAKEGDGAVVRGVGSVQVYSRRWEFDYVRSSIWEVASQVQVTARVSDAMRQAVKDNKFSVDEAEKRINPLLEVIHNDLRDAYVNTIFENPAAGFDQIAQTGSIGQAIQEFAINSVGARTNATIVGQLDVYAADPGVEITKAEAGKAQSRLLQSTGLAISSAATQAKVGAGAMRAIL